MKLLRLINATALNSGLRLDNVDRTHPVLASGKRVLQKIIKMLTGIQEWRLPEGLVLERRRQRNLVLLLVVVASVVASVRLFVGQQRAHREDARLLSRRLVVALVGLLRRAGHLNVVVNVDVIVVVLIDLVVVDGVVVVVASVFVVGSVVLATLVYRRRVVRLRSPW